MGKKFFPGQTEQHTQMFYHIVEAKYPECRTSPLIRINENLYIFHGGDRGSV